MVRAKVHLVSLFKAEGRGVAGSMTVPLHDPFAPCPRGLGRRAGGADTATCYYLGHFFGTGGANGVCGRREAGRCPFGLADYRDR